MIWAGTWCPERRVLVRSHIWIIWAWTNDFRWVFGPFVKMAWNGFRDGGRENRTRKDGRRYQIGRGGHSTPRVFIWEFSNNVWLSFGLIFHLTRICFSGFKLESLTWPGGVSVLNKFQIAIYTLGNFPKIYSWTKTHKMIVFYFSHFWK